MMSTLQLNSGMKWNLRRSNEIAPLPKNKKVNLNVDSSFIHHIRKHFKCDFHLICCRYLLDEWNILSKL